MASSKAAIRLSFSKLEERSLAPLIRELLERLGENPRRDGLARTPERVDQAIRFLTSGYQMNLDQIVNGALFEVEYEEMVVVKDIEYFSLCEHHMLPFFGRMHVAYMPRGNKVIGLSKIPRIVDISRGVCRSRSALHKTLPSRFRRPLILRAWR
jgi:GTP cyclohydrolase I